MRSDACEHALLLRCPLADTDSASWALCFQWKLVKEDHNLRLGVAQMLSNALPQLQSHMPMAPCYMVTELAQH